METEQQQRQRRPDASLGTLMSTLARDVSSLVSDEVQLAKTEMSQKTSQVTSGIGSVAAAGAILMCGFLVLLAAAVFGLNRVLPPQYIPWLSALIVGGVVTIIGLILLLIGRSKLQAKNLAPRHTIDSFRHDRQMARQHDGSDKEHSRNEYN